jgi:hypothetical protein
MSLMLRSVSAAALSYPYLKCLTANSSFVLVRQMGPEEQIDVDRAELIRIGSSAAPERGASLEGNPKTFFIPRFITLFEKKTKAYLSLYLLGTFRNT